MIDATSELENPSASSVLAVSIPKGTPSARTATETKDLYCRSLVTSQETGTAVSVIAQLDIAGIYQIPDALITALAFDELAGEGVFAVPRVTVGPRLHHPGSSTQVCTRK